MMIAKFYRVLEQSCPPGLKGVLPKQWRIWVGYQIKIAWQTGSPANTAQAAPSLIELASALRMPAGESQASLFDYLTGFYIKEDGPSAELGLYLAEAFKRFLYTLQMIPDGSGELLEIGANPYFMSRLLIRYTAYTPTFVNYFSEAWGKRATQTVVSTDGSERLIEFDNINIELECLPYAAASYDVVLLCEVLEHFVNDPLRALLEIKRVLKPEGILVLTTPNVARLEQTIRLIYGDNNNDVYSAYGPAGRHNREYTIREVKLLLEHLGFAIEEAFTSDVHPHGPYTHVPPLLLKSITQLRSDELGQYIFIRARNSQPPNLKRPSWLYRSYPAAETV